MDIANALPGITFWVEKHSHGPSIVHKAKGTAVLHADIDDFDIWEEVMRRLNGMRVHSIDDFHRQMLISLQQENETLAQQAERLNAEFRTTEANLRQGLSMSESERAKAEVLVMSLTAQVQKLHKEVAEYKQTVSELLEIAGSPGGVVGYGP